MPDPLTPVIPGTLPVADYRRVLVLVPHPDDEAIGCGGLLAQLHDLGIPTRVALVTDGSGAGALPDGTDRIRQAEFAASLQYLGEYLETDRWQYPDGRLEHATDLQAAIQAARDAFDATLLVAPWPGDLHPDHHTLGREALACHRAQPLPQGVLFYEVWSPLIATHLLDISGEWPRKQAALQCHQTALKHGDYERAMQGLARYRSLPLPGGVTEGQYAEAYHAEPGQQGADAHQVASLQVRFARSADAPGIAALFTRVFEQAPDADWWSRKYADQPHPGSVALDTQGAVVGFYGAQARTARWQGQHFSVCAQCDVMVARAYRFATRRQGVFVSLAERFLGRLVGDGKVFALSFGFPTPRALALGRRVDLYVQADDLHEWRASVTHARPGRATGIELTQAAGLEDWSWVDQLPALPPGAAENLHTLRSSDYWRSRFGEPPGGPYWLLRMTRWGRLCGAAILRPRGEALEVIDVALRRPRHWPHLMDAVHAAGGRFEASQLLAWGTATAMAAFPGGERHGAGSLALPGPSLNASLSEAVRGHCWLLGGDTDFR